MAYGMIGLGVGADDAFDGAVNVSCVSVAGNFAAPPTHTQWPANKATETTVLEFGVQSMAQTKF